MCEGVFGFLALNVVIPVWRILLYIGFFVIVAFGVHIYRLRRIRTRNYVTVRSSLDKEKFRSEYKHLSIVWTYSDYSDSYTMDDMRCGECHSAIVNHTSVGGDIYLVCAEGHLVGTDKPPQKVRQELDEENRIREEQEKAQEIAVQKEYQRLQKEVAEGRMTDLELLEWQRSFPGVSKVGYYTGTHVLEEKLRQVWDRFVEEQKRKSHSEIPKR